MVRTYRAEKLASIINKFQSSWYIHISFIKSGPFFICLQMSSTTHSRPSLSTTPPILEITKSFKPADLTLLTSRSPSIRLMVEEAWPNVSFITQKDWDVVTSITLPIPPNIPHPRIYEEIIKQLTAPVPQVLNLPPIFYTDLVLSTDQLQSAFYFKLMVENFFSDPYTAARFFGTVYIKIKDSPLYPYIVTLLMRQFPLPLATLELYARNAPVLTALLNSLNEIPRYHQRLAPLTSCALCPAPINQALPHYLTPCCGQVFHLHCLPTFLPKPQSSSKL